MLLILSKIKILNLEKMVHKFLRGEFLIVEKNSSTKRNNESVGYSFSLKQKSGLLRCINFSVLLILILGLYLFICSLFVEYRPGLLIYLLLLLFVFFWKDSLQEFNLIILDPKHSKPRLHLMPSILFEKMEYFLVVKGHPRFFPENKGKNKHSYIFNWMHEKENKRILEKLIFLIMNKRLNCRSFSEKLRLSLILHKPQLLLYFLLFGVPIFLGHSIVNLIRCFSDVQLIIPIGEKKIFLYLLGLVWFLFSVFLYKYQLNNLQKTLGAMLNKHNSRSGSALLTLYHWNCKLIEWEEVLVDHTSDPSKVLDETMAYGLNFERLLAISGASMLGFYSALVLRL